jgi:peptidoglycan/LPS O-acetylase OafA/YrhL
MKLHAPCRAVGVVLPFYEVVVKEKREFVWLNWLRFGLAVYIVLFHTLKEYYPFVRDSVFLGSFLNLGNFATTIFFVLSGFLLTYVYVGANGGIGLDKKKFWIARFSSLYPLHLLALLFSMPAFLFMFYIHGGISVPAQPIESATRFLNAWEIWLAVLMNVTLTQAWNPLYLLLNGPAWSLSALLFFYLVFPYAAPWLSRTRRPGMILLMLGCVFSVPGIIAQLLPAPAMMVDGLLHRNPLVRLPLFLAGIALAVLYLRLRDGAGQVRSPIPRWALAILVLFTVAGAAFVQSAYPESKFYLLRNGVYYPAAVAAVWLLAVQGAPTSAWNSKWSSRLGKTALPIFLLHSPIYDVFERVERFSRAMLMSDSQNFDLHGMVALARSLDHKLILFPVYLFLVVYLAGLCQERFVEPLQRYLRQKLYRQEKLITTKKALAA